jgi:hypothetical protein
LTPFVILSKFWLPDGGHARTKSRLKTCFFAFGRQQSCLPKALKALFDTPPHPTLMKMPSITHLMNMNDDMNDMNGNMNDMNDNMNDLNGFLNDMI